MKIKLMRSGTNGLGLCTLRHGSKIWRTRWIFLHLSFKPIHFIGW